MSAPGAAGAAGVSWIDVAASAAGIYNEMATIGHQAASGFASAFNSEWGQRAQAAMKLGGNVMGDFAALGDQAAQTFVGQFTRVLQGGIPDPKAFFDLFEHGVDDMVNDVVAKVPLIGPAFQKAYGVVQPVLDSFIGLTGELGETFEELGAKWMEMARTFGENTLDVESIQQLMTVTQQIAESGAVVSLKDVSEGIGLINQRIEGLNNEQLRELTTTVALADEAFHGAGPNVNYLTQALNSFEVAAGDANEMTIELVNASRASGQPINQMLMAMIQLGPAFRNMGYDAETAATFLGTMTKSGEPLARIAFAFNDVIVGFQKHGITDTQAAWTELINTMRKDVLDGHEELATQLAHYYDITPRAITMLEDAMKKGEPILPDELTAAQPLGNLHASIEEFIEKTRTLRDAWMQVSNILEGVLAPLGVGLEGGLISMTDHVRDWLESNKQQIIGWAGTIGHWVLTGIGDVAGVVSSTIKLFEPLMNAVFKVTATALTGILQSIHIISTAMEGMPFIGKDFKGMADATGDMAIKMKSLSEFDFAGNTEKFADLLAHISDDSIPALDQKLRDFTMTQKDSLALADAFTQTYSKEKGEAPAKQEVFSAETEDGLKLLGDKDTWKKVSEELAKLGIHMNIDEATGQVKSFAADTEAEAEALRKYLEEKFGEEAWKELSPKIGVTVAEAPPMSNEDARQKAGLPSEVEVPVKPIPGVVPSLAPPGPAIPPDQPPPADRRPPMPGVPAPAPGEASPWVPGAPLQPPTNPDMQPAPVPGSGANSPPGLWDRIKRQFGFADYAEIPSKVTVHAAANLLSPETLMDKAGVPNKYQGDVPGASPGIVLPSGLNVEDSPSHKSVQEVMDAVGIPFKNQGEDGVVLDVAFNTPAAGAGGLAGMGVGGLGGAYAGDAALLSNVIPGHYLSEPGVGDLTKGIGDCTSSIEDLVDNIQGLPTAGRSFATNQDVGGSAAAWLTAHGFIPNPTGANVPGAFNVGFNSHHAQATLPGGTNFNYGNDAAAANRGIGGTGAFDPALTSHYYLPMGGGAGMPPPAPAGGLDWDALAAKESSGNWAINTGNGYFGGLQFDDATWAQYGGTQFAPHANMATKDQQIMIAQRAYAARGGGSSLWPQNYSQLAMGGAVGTEGAGGSAITWDDVMRMPGLSKQQRNQLWDDLGHKSNWGTGWQTGGMIGGDPLRPGQDPHVAAMQQLAEQYGGEPYVLGGTGAGGIDCSALVGSLIANYLGEAAPGHGSGPGTMYTGDEADWLAARGFKPGIGPAGSIQVGFENYSAGGGHTVLRLPNGVAVEASSRPAPGMPKGGVRYGGDARSPTDPMFTDTWYLIPTRPLGRQSGGHVEGEWWPGRDSVPMDLSAGTFVVNRAMSQRHRGLLDQLMGSAGGAAGAGLKVPTILEVGERLVPPDVAARNLGLLHTLNQGRLGMQPGGWLPGYGSPDPKTVMQPYGTDALPPGVDASLFPSFTAGQAPYNPYTNPPPWPMTAKDQQDFKRSFDQWLVSQGDLGDSLQNATDQQNRANDEKGKADAALLKAETDLTDFTNQQHLAGDTDYDASDPNSKISKLNQAVANAKSRQSEAISAQNRADEGITKAKQRDFLSGETPPPEAPGMKKGLAVTPDQNAAQLGSGLVKGIFQELGFPDVFGKAFTNWGIWKLGMGGLGYGMGLLSALADQGGGTPGMGGGGGGGGLLGLLGGVSQGLGGPPTSASGGTLRNLFGGPLGAPPGPTNLFGGPLGPAPGPGGAPPPASDTAGVPQSQTPVNQPPGAAPAGYGGPGVAIYQNNHGLTDPQQAAAKMAPYVGGTSAQASSQTATAGGAGLP